MPPRTRKTVAESVDAFDRLRRRAADSKNRKAKKGIPDFVLGKAEGFEPEVRVTFPLSLKKQEAFYYANRNGDVFAQLRIMLGDEQYERVRDLFDTLDDGDDLLIGVLGVLLDHTAGKDADEVPGGSQGS